MHTISKRAAAMALSVLLLTLSVLTPLSSRAYSFRENGVDVSWYQGVVDWPRLAGNNDMRFVVLRAGKLASPTSPYTPDEYFDYNYTEACNVGLKVGCYARIAAGSREQLLSTIELYLSTIQGKSFDMPVYIDAEDDALAAIAKREGKTMLTQYIIEAMDMIYAAGHHPGLYANLNWYTNYLDANMVRARGYDLWLARYTNDCDSTDFSYSYDVWQYSQSGYYYGIGPTATAIDLDVSYRDYSYAGDHGRVHDAAYDGKLPAYMYPVHDSAVYYADGSAQYGHSVSTYSQCYVQEAYTNGWCRVLYDEGDGNRVGYLPVEAFFEKEQPTTEPTTENPEKDLVQDSLWNGILPLRAHVLNEADYQVYAADCTTLTGEVIGPDEECTVEAGFTNGWCRVKYQDSHVGYLPLSSFFAKERKGFGQLYTSAEIDVFGRVPSFPVGSISAKSLFIYTGETPALIQVIYADDGVRYAGWISKREWYSALLKLLNAHVHGKQPLLERQVSLVDCDGDGAVDVYDLALIKMRLDQLPDAFGL